MTVNDSSIFCGNCGLALEEESNRTNGKRNPCPSCGSTRRNIQVAVSDGITFKEKLGMKGRHPGGGKPYIEEVSGDDLHRKSGKWMKLIRVIDRDNDFYHEVVTDPVSGEVVHTCKEPLSQHRGHGTAKEKGKKKNG